jgi:hypothetical protein
MERQREITNYLDLSGQTKNHHNMTFTFCSLENVYDLHFKNKQEGHDGPEVAHLNKGPQGRASLNERALI